MKKIIIAIIVFVVVMVFTMPLFADPPADKKIVPPGNNDLTFGPILLGVSQMAKSGPGAQAAHIADTKALWGPVNLGQALKIAHKAFFNIPPK